MRRHLILVPLLAAAALTASCGSATSEAPRGAAALDAKAKPPLLRSPRGDGEIIVRATTSPRTAGPFTLHGTYRVRFEQYAPESPQMDFATQTSFVADLERQPGIPAVRLFRTAAATGARTVHVDGRYYVDVSFGDFPFVLRMTPATGQRQPR
ncbi:MAG TPA: hypothetical protein VK501_25005 [Baekduia sp.]|uniref:hypothetical protein n=1 Tax=Baekduia sp. TaxID=2600305 RepID=UPI002BE48980|nr:hypothetical protein [Baekduia sp.]HMJ37187.1 hypothetical protein [Baekduia sp.]